jgi:hypothetical protein
LPVFIGTVTGGVGGLLWPRIAALYIMAILPGLVVFAVAQRWYTKGLQEGALKALTTESEDGRTEVWRVAAARVATFQNLIVWQRARRLVREVYLTSKTWPLDEQFGLTNQVRRAWWLSIASNIAEVKADLAHGSSITICPSLTAH